MKLHPNNLVHFQENDLDIAPDQLYREHPLKPKILISIILD